MKKDSGEEWSRKAVTSSTPSMTNFDRNATILSELHYFAAFVSCFPKHIQSQFVPYMEILKNDPSINQQIKEKISSIQKAFYDKRELPKTYQEARNILKIYHKLYQATGATKITEYLMKCEEKVRLLEKSPQQRQKLMKKLSEHYPEKIERTDSLSKDFETFYRISKIFGTHNLGHHDRKAKDAVFEINPRLVSRLQEIMHYQSDAEQLGNILCLTYEGNKITGNKGYAVLDGNQIQWWEKRLPSRPEVSLVTENETEKEENLNNDEEKQNPIFKESRTSDEKFKLTQIFLGHVQKVTAVSVSYDELYMLSTGMDRCVKLWCLRLKTQLAEYYAHMGTVWDVQFAPTGYYFLTGGADNLAILWKTDEATPQRIFPHKGQVFKVDFLKNSDYVATAGEEGKFRIWKIISGECYREICFPNSILNFALSFSGAYLGLYESKGQVSVYDILKGQKVNSFRIYDDTGNNPEGLKTLKPHDICFSEDQKELCIVTSKNVILYSMDKLAYKLQTNIYESTGKTEQRQTPKEIIYMGRQVNLTYCSYSRKQLLVVAGTRKQ